MLQTISTAPSDPARTESAAHALFAVITELAVLMEEENRLLAEGYPAGVVTTSPRKSALSADYADLWEDIRADAAQVLAADPEFARILMHAVGELRQVAAENIARLEAAMAASRRRVEAALAALRDEAADGRPYSASGDSLLARFPLAGTDFHA